MQTIDESCNIRNHIGTDKIYSRKHVPACSLFQKTKSGIAAKSYAANKPVK